MGHVRDCYRARRDSKIHIVVSDSEIGSYTTDFKSHVLLGRVEMSWE